MENVNLKLDVTKIDKDRLFHAQETGRIYLDAVLIATPKAKYSDFVILQSITKEEREKGMESPILGDGNFFGKAPVKDDNNEEPKTKNDKLPF